MALKVWYDSSTKIWKERTVGGLDQIALRWPLFFDGSWNSPCFTEKLREMKWLKKCPEHCWRTMENELSKHEVEPHGLPLNTLVFFQLYCKCTGPSWEGHIIFIFFRLLYKPKETSEGYYVILWLFAASRIFRLDFIIIIILYYYVVFNPHVLFVHCSELLRLEQRGHFSKKYN